MSLFSKGVSSSDLKRLAAGRDGTKVEPGIYEVVFNQLTHKVLEDKGLEVVEYTFIGTDENESEDARGAVLKKASFYAEDPTQKEGWEQMNDITLGDAAKLLDATKMEAVEDASGNALLFQSLLQATEFSPRLMVRVYHTDEGRQELTDFQPSPNA